MVGEGGELARGTNLAGGILHKLGSGWVGRDGEWVVLRDGATVSPPAHPTRRHCGHSHRTATCSGTEQKTLHPSNWGTGYPKREGASKGHPAGADSCPHGVGSDPGVILVGISGVSELTLNRLSRVSVPGVTPGWA